MKRVHSHTRTLSQIIFNEIEGNGGHLRLLFYSREKYEKFVLIFASSFLLAYSDIYDIQTGTGDRPTQHFAICSQNLLTKAQFNRNFE